jgi:membrane protease YdiL (CAAX protease family)
VKKKAFPFPMRWYERVLGLLYLPIHCVVLPMFLYSLLALLGFSLSAPHTNLVYYAVGFLFLLITMWKYLKDTFSDFFESFFRSLQAVILGFVFAFFLELALSLALRYIFGVFENPNQTAILRETRLNANVMTIVAVLFAPVVEETLFRGVLFGSIRRRHRVLAYVVSALAFALYHEWQFALFDQSWSVLLYGLQYLPASLAFAWCYERSGSLWAPILAHAAINLIATISIGLA